ncbi:MAG TPA: methylated-DNA--[protein]-cysteine methyltransferase [Clostridium sp.]|jgi:methylated-DNA-[protein]-cysteine S-methyltransferase|uniref:Methylated-DNA--protein-cysteine methyltransferase n=1 Tax=Clostridium lapidicellarium TaxID=3240931 RepID=A0ABV4E0A9_9CLOT|nr:methylated-DNA--[protein]-cysteine S-methyltransferase [uncultured Clostridium sp.]NLU06821.1 methylated-DNA--[protein]-cysteine S-methyltransferase [Clostridiales bacterium]HBC97419.1 methylated-DNA--[protein]-cysteine methyltransferase [Clostridium sp.]
MNRIVYYNTVIGRICIVENEKSITNLYFENSFHKVRYDIVEETPLLKKANLELEEYFNGSRKLFDLPLAPEGTEFQKKVWSALGKIPYGETRSYKEIAMAVGNPKAFRAVGMANNRNPIPIFIPCHRVIGSNGDLVGYGGGLNLKEKLLKIEKTNAAL